MRFVKNFLSLWVLSVAFLSCRNRDEVSYVQNSLVNVEINLSLPQFSALQNIGGWVYFSGVNAGTRGLIIVRTHNARQPFIAYDRNAPHIPPDDFTTLSISDDNQFVIVCPKDNAKWNLLTGEPIAIAQYPPKIYVTYLVNNTLYIHN